jgi:hypothetical protein
MHTAAAEAPDNYIFRKLIRLIINAVYRTGALSYFSYKYREREAGKVKLWQVWNLYKAGEIERAGVYYEGELKIGEIG